MGKHKNITRVIGLFFCGAFLLANGANANIIVEIDSTIDKAIDEIAFYGLQLDAVSTDMYLYTGWDTEDKEQMKKASVIAIGRLDKMTSSIDAMVVPQEVEPLRGTILGVIVRFKRIYSGIEQKNIKRVSKELRGLWAKYTRDCAKLAKEYDFTQTKNAIKSANPEEGPVFTDKSIEETYKKAVVLMEQRKFKDAKTILDKLIEQVSKKSSEYDYIVLKLCDVLGSLDYDETQAGGGDSSELINQYSEEILSKNYSPLFYEFFVRWRTKTQEIEHGLSNWSEIPNWDYNVKRKQLIDKIRNYLASNPSDGQARLQLQEFINLDNIERGGPFGNYTLNYLGDLYMDPDSKADSKDGNPLKSICAVYKDSREFQDDDGKGVEIDDPYGEGKLRVKRTEKDLSFTGLGTELNKTDIPDIQIPEHVLPLAVGTKWANAEDKPDVVNRPDKMYFNYVEKVEDVSVPVGAFKNCFKIVYKSLPDETAEWYCPNVGIVKIEYHHHGTIDNRVIEMKGSCK